MPTITDIARECDVSIATVSMVINNKGRVGADTRNRVMDAVHRLHYDLDAKRPRPLPVQTDTIGLVLPRPLTPGEGFYYRAVLTVQTRSLEYGYDCKILTQQELTLRAVDNFYKGKGQLGCDAVILFCPGHGWETLTTNLRAWGVPVAVIRRPINEEGVVCLMDNEAAGGRLAGEHFASLGHRRMAMLLNPLGGTITDARFHGATDGFSRGASSVTGLTTGTDCVTPVEEILALMRGPDPVTALFVDGDNMAARVVRDLTRAGVRIPDELSVVGYDDDPEAVAGYPTLTTVRIPVEEMVGAACRNLARRCRDDERIATTLNFCNELIVRESTSKTSNAHGKKT